jgi:hypothetical protein
VAHGPGSQYNIEGARMGRGKGRGDNSEIIQIDN